MEFHITLSGTTPDPAAIEYAIGALDPAALADIDPMDHRLRVATSVDAVALVALINQAGYPVTLEQVYQVPSICCGGCSG